MSRFTALFEALAIEWLKAASQKAVAGLLKLSWDEIHGILERAVQRGLGRRQGELVSEVGIDEKAFRKGHSYLTLVNDLVRGRVLYVAEDRKQSSLDGFWETLTEEQISGSDRQLRDTPVGFVADAWPGMATDASRELSIIPAENRDLEPPATFADS